MRFFRKVFLRTLSVICIAVMSFAIARSAEAATVSLSPSSIQVHAGDMFSVAVRVSSSTESINAVSAKIIFPKQLLQVTGISKNGSVLNFWVQEPSFSNTLGSASFEGVAVNPGYRGSSGKIATITFRALKEGIADLSLTQVAVLANDGEGTNVFTGATSSRVTITPVRLQTGLSVVSPTHSDTTLWYNSSTVQLVLTLPSSTDSIRYSFDTTDTAIPKDEIAPVTTIQKTLDDGVWYFHVQAKTNGLWGKVVLFPVHIDTSPPLVSFDIDPLTLRRVPVATDALSGVLKLLAVSADAIEKEIQSGSEGDFGNDTTFIAYDKAGNRGEVKSANSNLLRITEFPITAKSKTSTVIKGTSGEPGAVVLFAKHILTPSFLSPAIHYVAPKADEFDYSTQTTSTGSEFKGVFTDLSPGVYTIVAKTEDGSVSNTVFIKVTSSFWVTLWSYISTRWYILAFLLILVVLVFLVRIIAKSLKKQSKYQAIQGSVAPINKTAGDRYTILLQKIELGIPLSLEERVFIQKLRQYLASGGDKDA